MIETLNYTAKKQAEKASATGYDKAKSDAVKREQWLLLRDVLKGSPLRVVA